MHEWFACYRGCLTAGRQSERIGRVAVDRYAAHESDARFDVSRTAQSSEAFRHSIRHSGPFPVPGSWPRLHRATEKAPDLQGFFRWRNPDSNRGHHDSQSCAPETLSVGPSRLEQAGPLPDAYHYGIQHGQLREPRSVRHLFVDRLGPGRACQPPRFLSALAQAGVVGRPVMNDTSSRSSSASPPVGSAACKRMCSAARRVSASANRVFSGEPDGSARAVGSVHIAPAGGVPDYPAPLTCAGR